MTYMIIFVLLVLLIILSIALIRYHLALKNLSQQIEDKILTGSMKRVGVSVFSKHFLHLYQQIENLFLEVCLLYTSPSPRDPKTSRMPSSA